MMHNEVKAIYRRAVSAAPLCEDPVAFVYNGKYMYGALSLYTINLECHMPNYTKPKKSIFSRVIRMFK